MAICKTARLSGEVMDKKKAVCEAHFSAFGEKAEFAAAVPRVFSILGDYSRPFCDLSVCVPVKNYVCVAASRRKGGTCRIFNSVSGETKSFASSECLFKREDKWANEAKAVLSGFLSGGISCTGFDMTIACDDAPFDSAGQSASLSGAEVLALRALFAPKKPVEECVSLVKATLNKFFGQNLSFVDVLAALKSKNGAVLAVNSAKLTCESLPFAEDCAVVVVDSKVSNLCSWNPSSICTPEIVKIFSEFRAQKTANYAVLRNAKNPFTADCDEKTRRYVAGISGEAVFCENARQALEKGSPALFAREVNRSFKQFSDFYLFTCPETEWVAKRAHELDSNFGESFALARMIGPKFGRLVAAMMSKKHSDAYIEKLDGFEKAFGFPCVWNFYEFGGECL